MNLDITKEEFEKIASLIKSQSGINLKFEHKKNLMISRLQNSLVENNFNNFTQYYNYVKADKTGNTVKMLVEKLTTNYSFFMREADHFDYFKTTILPYLKMSNKNSRDLRIWSAGCSTGEEPYTLAMILRDFFELDTSLWDTKVLATDISTKVLEIAKKGIYPNEHIHSLPNNWRRKYFVKEDDTKSRICDKIKKEVLFRNFNLMNKEYPFRKKFHVIFCRNVMIYFEQETKKKLINKFYNMLEYGGYLFIGHSETINREESKFKYVMPSVYRKE